MVRLPLNKAFLYSKSALQVNYFLGSLLVIVTKVDSKTLVTAQQYEAP